MCGIVGKLNFNKKVDHKCVTSMLDTVRHRGPDAGGTHVEKNIGLGHSRLSIIDLSERGKQPMSDAEKTVWLTFNGEIYNFREIRKELEKDGVEFRSETDSEVIIHLYKKHGTDCVKYLHGMFAFAVWDSTKERLFIARDRLGQKPVKYYHDENTFIFASELKAILKNSEVQKEIDYDAIDEFLTYQYAPHPKTGFQNIFKLEPGHFMTVSKNGETHKEKYWQLDYLPKEKHTEKEWKEKTEEKLKEAVQKRLMSDVPLGAHLSGGIDSSIIVALMAQAQSEPVKTFAIGFEEDSHNELPWAKKVADYYETEHHEFIVKPDAIDLLPKIAYHYEEPYADASAIPTWYLSELTKKHVTVALNGDAGDENFAGYTRYTAMQKYKKLSLLGKLPQKERLANILGSAYNKTNANIFRKGKTFLERFTDDPADFYKNLVGYLSQADKELVYTSTMHEQIKNSRASTFLPNLYHEADRLDPRDQLLYTDVHSYLPNDLLVKVDIASMAHGLEVRSPFLDHEFVEHVAKMPAKYKLKSGNKKYLLKQIAYDYLPKECIDRPKQGFGVPLEKWFRNELKSELETQLLSDDFLQYGFKKEGIEHMIETHATGKKNYHNQLWALLVLRNWFKQWFE